MEYLRQYEILLKKARSDYLTAKLVFENTDDIDIDVALFHLQQAVEKSLKSILIFKKIEFPKTHKLEILIKIIKENNIKIVLDESLMILNEYAVEARYDYLSDTFENFSETIVEVEKLMKKVEKMIEINFDTDKK